MIKIILDAPIVPYVRMTRKGKFVDQRAQEYLSNRALLRYSIIKQYDPLFTPLIEQTPLAVTLHFEVVHLHKGDLDNLIKAILDAAQGIIYANDCWIDSIQATRVKSEQPRTVLIIERINNEAPQYRHKKKVGSA